MSQLDLVEGEEIVLRATLQKDRWIKHRCVSCSCRCVAAVYVAPILVPLYALFGGGIREEEADSFELVLTNQNIHFSQKIYGCGLFCQQVISKVIPLDRIQDIALISDWMGDNCGIVDTPGEVYQIHVQTAAMGTKLPELIVICIENPREFKKSVMEAKNRLKQVHIPLRSPLEQQLQSAHSHDVQRILELLQQSAPTNQV